MRQVSFGLVMSVFCLVAYTCGTVIRLAKRVDARSAQMMSMGTAAQSDLESLKSFAYGHGKMLMEEVGGSKALLRDMMERCQ